MPASSQLRFEREKSSPPYLGSPKQRRPHGRADDDRCALVGRSNGHTSWQAMAWWIHDNLPYSELQFFPKLFAFNIGWHEAPKRTIYSFIEPRGFLTKPGFSNHDCDHSHSYKGFPQLKRMS